jgi:hypothetical protein
MALNLAWAVVAMAARETRRTKMAVDVHAAEAMAIAFASLSSVALTS